MFEYLMAGIPVITSNLFEMKRLVEKYRVGVVAEENTVQGFIDATVRVQNLNYDELVQNVHSACKIFNWENESKKLLALYQRLESAKND